ncbi:MAG: acyltransferase, partial [Hymenobacteraceae bacterium]|nr:acyltransferase [Hymenobacteraceae bacterium]
MTSPALPYIRTYDGIRAGAVGLVMLSHWPFGHWQLPLGWVGVQVFFVLSGLLITRLLVADRDRPLGGFLRRFYWRRTLRIFPLYFFYLLLIGGGVLLAARWPELAAVRTVSAGNLFIRADGGWLATYLYNWQDVSHWFMSSATTPAIRLFDHLWSLSVEEQFYLVFPLIVWAVPPAQLRWLLWSLVLGAPLVRSVVGELVRAIPAPPQAWPFFLTRATIFYLDALAIGGLLALGLGQGLAHPGRWLVGALLVGAGLNILGQAAAIVELGHPWPSWRWLGYEHPLRLHRI